MCGRFVGRLVVGIDPQLTERLAVVAADPDGGLVEDTEIIELRTHGAHGIVRETNPDVVAVEELLDLDL
jgi:hypothetical protein